ncbi:MAG: addiction module protein [Cyanobacteria bacterium P01_F01_bin.143]
MSNPDISIAELSVTEKLSLMERIWVDLEKRPSEIPSPNWYGDILAQRRQSIKNNESEFIDWDNTFE